MLNNASILRIKAFKMYFKHAYFKDLPVLGLMALLKLRVTFYQEIL